MSSLYPGIKIVGKLDKKDKELLEQASEVLLHFETSIGSKIELEYNTDTKGFDEDFPPNESTYNYILNVIVFQMKNYTSSYFISTKLEVLANLLTRGFEDAEGYNGLKLIEPFRNFPKLRFLSDLQNSELKQMIDRRIRFVEDH